jgi:hypothetical protein
MTGPFQSRLANGFAQKFGEGQDRLPGPPVRTVTFGPRGESIQELKRVERGSIAAAEFEEPGGLQKKTMADMMPSR